MGTKAIIYHANCDGEEFIAMRDFAMHQVVSQEEFGGQSGITIDQSLTVARLGKLLLARGKGTAVNGWLKFRFAMLLVLTSDDSELTEDQIVTAHLWVCPTIDAESVANQLSEMRDTSGLDGVEWRMLWMSAG